MTRAEKIGLMELSQCRDRLADVLFAGEKLITGSLFTHTTEYSFKTSDNETLSNIKMSFNAYAVCFNCRVVFFTLFRMPCFS